MEPVWMPSLSCVFKPNHEAVKRLLPEVSEVEWRFFDLDGENRFDPHLVSEARIRFRNDRVLTVPGHALWKFRAMVLPGLGTKSGYLRENPYSPDTSEGLANRIRAAHDACCFNGNPIEDRRPISITHDLVTGVVVPRFRTFLSKESVLFLLEATKDVGEAIEKEVLAQVRDLVELETSRPRFDLGFKNLGNGMMGRVPVEAPWPDLNTVPFGQFLQMMSRDQQEGCPAQLSMLQKFNVIVQRLAVPLCENVVAQARRMNPGNYAKACRELGCKAKSPSVATFCKALAASDDRNLVADGLWGLWHKRFEKFSLGEILAIRVVK